MAEVRLTPAFPAAPTVAPQRTSDAARAAQQAFFQAALKGTAAVAPAAAPEPVRTATPASSQPQQAAAPPASPARSLRPGALLDIRV